MGIFSKFFNSKKSYNTTEALAFLEVDMHNHILPGIDDGSVSVEDSLFLIDGIKNLGIKKIICTPHIISGLYPNTKNSILNSWNLLQPHLDEHTEIFPAAEHMIDDGLSDLINQNQLCVMPNGHVLIEMSFLAPSISLFEVILKIQNLGYTPILAHPERYLYYKNDLKIYTQIKDAGCLIQLNLLAISRYYGQDVKKTAQYLLNRGMYDFVGTDLHHKRHLECIQQVCSKYDIKDIVKNCSIKNNILL